MSDAVKKTEQHAHKHKTSSSRVLRTVTYVLTPFLILVILCSTAVLALFKPFKDFKPYLDTTFGATPMEVRNLRTINKYRDDDAPDQVKEVEIEINGKQETHTMVYPYYGDYYAELNCEAAGMKNIPVYSGQDNYVLEKGAGWYNGSVFIGRPGNVVIAGHNHTFFYNLPKCEIGDVVTLETCYCKCTYIIDERVVFHESDYTYVYPTDDDRLTMYTCWNEGRLGMSQYRLAFICKLKDIEWKEVETKE
ncbi:MAG: class D sortase [Ruminococcus sp.]|uniref:Sortase A n=1 Tax=Ruminococcus albus TaxID=1264 RepID=A0A1H7PFC7_RUMAL|nr:MULTISPECIES: class D sortase [Ruminococcus]MBO4867628.1 class D sortase [Ruminococcus sp.]SEL34158.1 sortase A [Ruminococcus albus]